jgi:hypothetical protein
VQFEAAIRQATVGPCVTATFNQPPVTAVTDSDLRLRDTLALGSFILLDSGGLIARGWPYAIGRGIEIDSSGDRVTLS